MVTCILAAAVAAVVMLVMALFLFGQAYDEGYRQGFCKAQRDWGESRKQVEVDNGKFKL